MNQKVTDFINQKITIEELCLPHFYPTVDRFDKFQAGYKYNAITGEKSKVFNENWFTNHQGKRGLCKHILAVKMSMNG
jgi:hypothetical protein